MVWTVDVTGTISGLLLALLAAHDQQVKYLPGRTVNTMSGAYRGEAKTDARDAYVFAETVRQRGDLTEVEVEVEVGAMLVTELKMLVTHAPTLSVTGAGWSTGSVICSAADFPRWNGRSTMPTAAERCCC